MIHSSIESLMMVDVVFSIGIYSIVDSHEDRRIFVPTLHFHLLLWYRITQNSLLIFFLLLTFYFIFIQIGSVFAINRQFFWDLGAYDKLLQVSHGEQLEMSFKAHLCAHGLFECPCSRVAHSYRYKNYYKRFENGTDFAARNMKRIAEVWMVSMRVGGKSIDKKIRCYMWMTNMEANFCQSC